MALLNTNHDNNNFDLSMLVGEANVQNKWHQQLETLEMRVINMAHKHEIKSNNMAHRQ